MQEQVFLKFHFEEPSRVLFSVIGLVVDPSSTQGIKASFEKWEGLFMFFDQKKYKTQDFSLWQGHTVQTVRNQSKNLNKWVEKQHMLPCRAQGVTDLMRMKRMWVICCGLISTPLNTYGMCKTELTSSKPNEEISFRRSLQKRFRDL